MGVLRMGFTKHCPRTVVTSIERTRSVEISIKISMISRAASRLSTVGGMV